MSCGLVVQVDLMMEQLWPTGCPFTSLTSTDIHRHLATKLVHAVKHPDDPSLAPLLAYIAG